MNKIILIIGLSFLTRSAYADNSLRISELQNEQGQIQQSYAQLEKQKEALKERFISNNGAIQELQKQDENEKQVQTKKK